MGYMQAEFSPVSGFGGVGRMVVWHGIVLACHGVGPLKSVGDLLGSRGLQWVSRRNE
jgi:hypothetical protein